MWTFTPEPLPNGVGLRYTSLRDGTPLTYAQVLDGWADDPAFGAAFTAALADAPLAGYRWETPPITAATVDRPFEFVLLAADGFGTRPDGKPFADAFAIAGGAEAVAFPNLGRDAILVVPCRTAGPAVAYAHLAAFVRRAGDAQRIALWRVVAGAVRGRLGDRPLWLSTAGYGVAWLHVRIDDRPKYYGHAAYRSPP